jgi:hypothetical protein
MANEKISELPSGAPAQANDAIPIARGGSNYSLAVSNLTGGFGGGLDVQIGGNTSGTTGLVSTGTLFLAGGNNVTLSQNGQSITISANTAAAATLSISAGTTSGGYAGITFANSNGLSFGLNNGTITGSAAPGFSAGVSNIGNTSGSTGISGSQLVLAGGNNMTLSQATGANGATVTFSAAAQTNQSLGVYGVLQTTGQSSSSTFDARSLSIVGAGNVSVGMSLSSLVISGATAAGLTTGGIYAAGNTTGQSSSSTYQQTALNISGAGLISIGFSSNSLIISAPATTGITQSIYATGNTTQSSSGTASFGSLLVAGSGNVSVGMTNGSLVISGSGGGAGGGVGFGVSTFGNTAGATGTVTTGNVILVGSGVISLSQATGAAGSAATISILAPATSSLSATGFLSLSVNGSTISIGAALPQLSFFQPLGPVMNTTVTQNGLGSVQVYPAANHYPFTATRVDMMASVSAAALAVSTEAQTLSMYVGLYSLNGSTLSLASSGSQSYAWSNNSGGSTASITGLRRFSAPINVNYTGGFNLFVALMTNTTYVNTNGISLSNVVVPLGPGPQLQGLIGQVPSNSMQFVPGQGIFSATSAALPSSMGLSAISGAGSGGNAVDYYAPVQFVNVTA